jgi:bifunctional DNA-binding transcriptional regulator/antitoxin component of YhaV-PrlF toxin-antitoxin module
MGLFQPIDPFFIIQGTQPIVVAAPHHGTRPNVDSDLVTGPIARELADHLNARTIVVSDLRRTVDVNKNPLGLQKHVRPYALRYQNEVFRDLPRLVIEVHGHISGQYPIEISSGFDLDPASPGDTLFLERLHTLKRGLSAQLRKIGLPVAVGVYPLDRDVKKSATNTYTFQKIRRARNRVGMEWYGLHIEIAADLRTGQHAKAPGYFDALTGAFAAAIRSAFESLAAGATAIPTHTDVNNRAPVTGTPLRVIKAAQDSLEKMAVALHPHEISTLGFLEGDLLPLYNHGETLRVPLSASSKVAVGKIAVPARVRRQLDLNPGDLVMALRTAQTSESILIPSGHAFVIGKARSENAVKVWMHPSDIDRLQDEASGAYHCKGPFPSADPVAVQLLPEENTMERVVSASDVLMNKLTLSVGDTIMIETSL